MYKIFLIKIKIKLLVDTEVLDQLYLTLPKQMLPFFQYQTGIVRSNSVGYNVII